MDLFGEVPPLVPGFVYHPDFLTELEEQNLLTVIKSSPLRSFTFQGYEANRRVESLDTNTALMKKASAGRGDSGSLPTPGAKGGIAAGNRST